MSTAIGVAIGLILMYLVLSLIASGIQESIAAIFAKRATDLEKGIATLLGDALKGDFYGHSLVKSLSNAEGWFSKRPSYISAQTFSTVVLDLVAGPGRDAPAPQASNPPPGDDLTKVWHGLQPDEAKNKLCRGPLQAVLTVFAREEQSLEGVKKRLEGWFDESMDRVSGWYKRWTRLMVFCIGFVLAFLLNADTLNIANTLWTDAAVRARVEQVATQEAQQSQPTVELEELSLPLGWILSTSDPTNPENHPDDPRHIPSGWGILAKLAGLLITAIALTLGAPFWFDLLKRFVEFRSSGPSPTSDASTGQTGAAAPGSN